MNTDALNEGVQRLFALYEREPVHPLHVAWLAGQLAQGLESQVSVTEQDRKLMNAAAKLHDIGWTVSGPEGSGHHKATARLIRQYDWKGLDQLEIEQLAMVARYHRKALPSLHHTDYAALGIPEQRRVRYLGGIVRLADALDRRHLQKVRTLVVQTEASSIRILLKGTDDLEAEVKASYRKCDLLEQELGKRFEFLVGGLAEVW